MNVRSYRAWCAYHFSARRCFQNDARKRWRMFRLCFVRLPLRAWRLWPSPASGRSKIREGRSPSFTNHLDENGGYVYKSILSIDPKIVSRQRTCSCSLMFIQAMGSLVAENSSKYWRRVEQWEWEWDGVTVPVCLSHLSHGLTWSLTRASPWRQPPHVGMSVAAFAIWKTIITPTMTLTTPWHSSRRWRRAHNATHYIQYW